MKYKKWLKTIFFIITVSLTVNIFLNYYTDPNFIFTKQQDEPLKCLTHFGGPNERFLKINHILENNNKYDSFIFGSSRVGKINMNQIKGASFYNMTYAAGYPTEHLAIIKLFLENGIKIKNLWIGLDDFSYTLSDEKPYQWTLSRPHWKMKLKDNDNIIRFYFYYLLKIISLKDIEAKFNQLIDKSMNFTLYDIYNTGMPKDDEKNLWIENHKEEHNLNKSFLEPFVLAKGNYLDISLNNLKKIKQICDDNNITLTIFINPLHKVTYLNNDFEQFLKFKDALSSIADYYDFAYLNDITSNNYYYFETSHYRSIVGDMIIKSILSNDNSFGKFITKDNFQKHKKFLVYNLDEKV